MYFWACSVCIFCENSGESKCIDWCLCACLNLRVFFWSITSKMLWCHIHRVITQNQQWDLRWFSPFLLIEFTRYRVKIWPVIQIWPFCAYAYGLVIPRSRSTEALWCHEYIWLCTHHHSVSITSVIALIHVTDIIMSILPATVKHDCNGWAWCFIDVFSIKWAFIWLKRVYVLDVVCE